MVVIKENTQEYTPIERLEIVMEGINGSVAEIAKKYNISRDTYYTWKNSLIGSIEGIWGENHSGRRKTEENVDVEALKKEVKELRKQAEVDRLIKFKKSILIENMSDEFKKKHGFPQNIERDTSKNYPYSKK